MSNQNYCEINNLTNVCENIVVWDGNPESWTPPENCLMLLCEATPAKIWDYDRDSKTWFLSVVVGAGNIEFTWDGQYLVTNQSQPEIIVTATPGSGDIPQSVL